jgi:hypothetical protein
VKLSVDSGSTPLELIFTAALLLLPIAPTALLYQQLANELAAESIARHALRAAILRSPENPVEILDATLQELSANWGVLVTNYEFWCSNGCEITSLRVQVGGANAIASMGLEP